MSSFLQDAEQDLSGGDNQQGSNDQSGQQQSGSNDSSSGSSSSGGFMQTAERTGEDGMVNQEVNTFMNKEGVPAGADGAVDNAVDSEANKFL